MTTTGFQLQPAGHSFRRTIIDPSLLPPKKRAAAVSLSPTTTTGLQLHLAAGGSLSTTVQIHESLLPPKKRPTSTTSASSSSSSSLLLVSPPMRKRRMDYSVVDAGAKMAAALQQAGPAGACGAMMTMGSKRARKASSRYSADVWTL